MRDTLIGLDHSHVDLDRNLAEARRFGVRATPTLILYSAEGVELRRVEGLLGPRELLVFLDPDETPEFGDLMAGDVTWTPEGYRSRAICFSHVGYGPLNIQSQSPGHALRLGLAPRTPSTLTKGRWEVGFNETFTNIWSYKKDDYRLDYGTFHTTVAGAYGLTDKWLAELELSELTRTASHLDPLTNLWHDTFGYDDAGRDDFEERDNAIEFHDPLDPANDISNTDSGLLSRDLSLTLQNNITCGTAKLPAISVAATARWHAGGDDALEGDPWSFGVSGSMARRFGFEHYGYVGLGFVRHGMTGWQGLELEREQASALLGWEWRYHKTCSWVIQYLMSDGVAVNRAPFDEVAHEIYLGWKGELGRSGVYEFGLVENAVTADNSADVGLHFGYRRRF